MSLVLEHPYAQALAWALIHFIWQGALIALALVTVQHLGRLSASARYTSGVVAMAAMLMAPAATFARLVMAAPVTSATLVDVATAPLSIVDAVPASDASTAFPAQSAVLTTFILIAWTIGVVVLSLRLLGGWFVARRLARRALSPASAEVQAMARRVAGRLALDRVVSVFESSAVSVPMMIGWMKPVVLLPAAALSGLSTMQLEALLAHELAHVRRHDYLVNLLQSGVETLLFYHPAVWFVSRRTRIDREHCCDDLAVDVCDRVVYATALSDLAAMARTPRVALAATDGPLLSRVRRILGQSSEGRDLRSGWLSVSFVVLLVGSIAPSALTRASQEPATPGVVGGVQGGVAEGVVGGVSGGVAGGVVGGVISGVISGVAGGVQGGPDLKPQERPVEVKPEPAQTAEQKEIEQKIRQLDEEFRKLQQARMDNEMRRALAQSEARIEGLHQQLAAATDEARRVYELLGKSMATESQVAEARAKVRVLESQLQAEMADREFQKVDTDLRKKQMALEVEATKAKLSKSELSEKINKLLSESADVKRSKEIADEKLYKDVKDTLYRADVTKAEAERVAKSKLMEEEQLTLAADREKMARLVEELKMRDTEVASEIAADVQVRAGDLVLVTIHNEPDLPKIYKVQTDGTIRFPFLGAIKVQGLTSAQVQDTLARQLVDRKMATASSAVEVHVKRAER